MTDLIGVKYDSGGNKQWTQQMGTSADDIARAITSDSSGNVYVAGHTKGGLDGNNQYGPFIDNDFFVVKYNSNGVKQWTQQFGTPTNESAFAITSDSSGNVYVAGRTYGSLDGSTSVVYADLFIIKYDKDGAKQWTQQLGTSDSYWLSIDYAYGITTDSSSNVYVTGFTSGNLDGNTSAGSSDLFVVKYDSGGIKQWTQQLGTSSDDHAYGIITDSSNNVYVTGYTNGGLDGNTSAGSSDLFVVKYDSGGNKQ